MTVEEFAARLTDQFPEKKQALQEHYQAYNRLLGHVFFGDEINIPLVVLLEENRDRSAIEKYCDFIEGMWFQGDTDARNIVEVTIIERLTDDPLVWRRFGQYITKEFRWKINDSILPMLALQVPKLSTDIEQKKRRKEDKSLLSTKKSSQ